MTIANNMAGAVMDLAPYMRFMYDSGTFKDLVGRGARALMINIRELPKPYPVNTASKTLWNKEACDLLLNGVVIKECLINPSDMEISLLSEGVLALFEKWEFHMDWQGKKVAMPNGEKHWGWRESIGVLFYVPPELLPNRHEDMNQLNGQYAQQMEQLDYEIDQIQQMQEMEQKLNEKKIREESGSYALTRTEAAKKAKESKIMDVATDAEIELAEIDEIADKSKITDMCATGLHKPKLKGCDICEQAYMQAEPARSSKQDTAELTTDNDNLNSDLNILNEPDSNGSIAAYHGFLTKGKIGYAAAITDKYSTTTTKCGRTAKVWMKQVARAGGRPNYKIGSEKADQGTEFKGAYKDANMNGEHGDEVWQTGGDAGRHECCAQIENENKWIAMEASATSLEGTANEDQVVAVSGEAIVAARQVLNHTIRGEVQKNVQYHSTPEQI